MSNNVFVFGTSALVKMDTYTFTSGAAGNWLVVKPKSEELFTQVKSGLGDSAFLGNIDATVYIVEMIVFKGSQDAKYLNGLYIESELALVQSDFAILNKVHTFFVTDGFTEFNGRNGKITSRTDLLTVAAQGSENERSQIKFTLTFSNGSILIK